MNGRFEWISSSARATRRLGTCVGAQAWPGLVIALNGDLGTGKTCLVQGLALGLGVPPTVRVTSPTFNLVNSYDGRLPLHHLDVYRLADPDELEYLGFRDLLGSGGVTVVEWAERFWEVLPREFVQIELSHRSPRTRQVVVTSTSGSLRIENLVAHLSKQFHA